MALHSRFASLWRNLTDKESVDEELNEELRAHVDLLTDKNLREGLSPEQARRDSIPMDRQGEAAGDGARGGEQFHKIAASRVFAKWSWR